MSLESWVSLEPRVSLERASAERASGTHKFKIGKGPVKVQNISLANLIASVKSTRVVQGASVGRGCL